MIEDPGTLSEPGSLALSLLGAAGVIGARRRSVAGAPHNGVGGQDSQLHAAGSWPSLTRALFCRDAALISHGADELPRKPGHMPGAYWQDEQVKEEVQENKV